ncbi:MAG: glycosyltransferase family 2 protein [Verrucomicrobiia bacterium]
MPKPAVSIIIALHNQLALTQDCLRSLTQTLTHHTYEVILVDDCSTDGTRDFLATLNHPYHVILNETRSGFARNNNRAAQQARAPILCFLNNDTVLQPGWLEPMLQGLAELPNPGLVGNLQWSPKTRTYDHMGIVFDPLGQPFHFGKYFILRPYRGFTRWGAVTAACALIQRDLFLSIGGFDTAYQNGSEDVDLCLRLEQLGKHHYVANNSIIHHLVSSSPGRHHHTSRNEQILLERWSDLTRRTWAIWDQDLYAINYALRFLTRPWRYNGPKLVKALTHLIHHPARAYRAFRVGRR